MSPPPEASIFWNLRNSMVWDIVRIKLNGNFTLPNVFKGTLCICSLEPFAKPQLSDFFVEIHIKHAYCITNILLVCRNQVIQLNIFVLSGLFILHEVHVHIQVLQLSCNYVYCTKRVLYI